MKNMIKTLSDAFNQDATELILSTSVLIVMFSVTIVSIVIFG
jgi:hypothetical protein